MRIYVASLQRFIQVQWKIGILRMFSLRSLTLLISVKSQLIRHLDAHK